MKIGIDARMYGRASRGIGRYLQELISYLEVLDTSNEYLIFLRSENFDEYEPKNPNFKKILAPWRWYSFSEQIFLPLLLYRHGCDLIHFPHFNVPVLYRGKFIVTIHDLILIRDTQERATRLSPVFYRIKKFFYKLIIRSACRRAQKIIALTEFGKNDLLSFFSISADKINVIAQGVSDLTMKIEKMDMAFEFLYNTDERYILYVGSAYPHKDLSVLIRAMDLVNEMYPFDLVLVGAKDFFYDRLLKEYPRDYLKYFENVTDFRLAELYKKAFCLVFPSRYEGFGLPPLEAMRYGCPVVASNASCLPEVLGEAALFAKRSDIKDFADKIIELIKNHSLHKSLIQKGFKRTCLYSWESCARQTYKLYERTTYKNKTD